MDLCWIRAGENSGIGKIALAVEQNYVLEKCLKPAISTAKILMGQ
jgi:hypothetical protein